MTEEEIISKIKDHLSVAQEEAEKIIEKAESGGEIKTSLEEWLNERFIPNTVFINEKGYAEMCIDALKILGTTAATDYGGSRQRDFGQMWADMTRGYLGELAFKLFLQNKWNISADLDHEAGKLEDYLPTDIHKIKKPNEQERKPNLKVCIKTTKWNGIWLDIPGSQFDHSDLHILIKIGIGRDHLFAYFKKISVFKDKVLRVGQEIGSLSGDEAENLYGLLPNFKPVPAYICGFVWHDSNFKALSYKGKKGNKNYNITEWNGPVRPGDLEKIKEKEQVKGSIEFEGIGTFAHDTGYLFNAGNLLWTEDEWKKVIKKL